VGFYTDTTVRPTILIGYNGGASEEQVYASGPVMAQDKWYHCAYTYDGSSKAWKIRVWDEDAGTVTETTGTMVQTMNIESQTFYMDSDASSQWPTKGNMDEVVIFNDVLTSDEIDQIRLGTYGAPTGPIEGNAFQMYYNPN